MTCTGDCHGTGMGTTSAPLGSASRGAWAALLVLVLLLAGCAPAWETALVAPDGATVPITRQALEELAPFADEDDSVPLERVLYTHGFRLIETLEVTTADGQTRRYDWAAVAETALWQRDGALHLGQDRLHAARVAAAPPPVPAPLTTSLLDIAPTVCALLGLPAPAAATGTAHALASDAGATPRRLVLIFLDAFGYLRYTEALEAGLIPNLAALAPPALGLAAYPPSTSVASAVLLTGAPPELNGVATRGIRATETETFFDVAAAAGLRGVAVEGEALAFNMRNTELVLSGDRDGDGSTDDNVLANALNVLAQGMPDILWVHFHGIDDAGHTYGPDAPEERAKIVEVDAAVGMLLAALPPDTAVLIFADHGMHAVTEAGRAGNHGQLIARDMLVPIWAFIQ
jgi:hypothetical protein